jgi:hypothetical protein
LTSIGHTAAYAITFRRISVPDPKSRNAIGMRATAGIGLRNSSTTNDASNSNRELPMSTPARTPTTIARVSPPR